MDGRRRKTVHAARRPEERPKDASHSSAFTVCTSAMRTLPSFAGPTSARSVTRTVRMRFSVGTAPRDLMPEVAAGTPNTGVAPRAVLGGPPDDAPADRVHDPWAARSATAAAVVLPRDQRSMPAAEGIGRDQGVPVTAYPSPEALGLCG